MKPWISLLRDTLAATMIVACLYYNLVGNGLLLTGYTAIYLGLSLWMSRMPHQKGRSISFAAKVLNYLMLYPVVCGIMFISLIKDAAFGWTLAAITIAGMIIGNRKPKEQQEAELSA